MREPLASLGEELARISAEIQSINSGFQVQVEQAITEERAVSERQFQVRLQEELERMRAQFVEHLTALRTEIERVSGLLEGVSQEIATMIDDPNVELSKVMRMKAEESVLRAYLDGLKFSAGPKA